MALLGAYKPKYETTFSGVAKQAPISSVVSLGLVPAIGSLAGKVLETGRAMFSDTGDPMAMVKGRTQQVAGELSDYTNGKAGKPTITTPLAPAAVSPAPVKQAPITDVSTTFGDVGLPKMGPRDLSKLSTGAIPTGRSTRRAPVRNTASKPAATTPAAAPISEVQNDALQTPGYQVPGSNNITRIDSIAPGQFNSDFGPQGVAAYNTPAGGGIASNGDETFVLRGRTPAEEAAFKSQQAQVQNTQPITALAQPAQQTSTVGYGHGVYELAPGQNAPPDFNAMSLGDMASYKFGVNQQVKQAGIANINSEINNRQAITQMAQQEQPYKIAGTIADTRNKNFATDNGIVMSPLIQENTKATTDHTKASTLDIIEMMNPKKNMMLSDIRYKDGLLKIAGDKLAILKEQIATRAKQAATKGNAADWGGISKSSLEGIKLIDAKASLGGLTPEDEQLRKNYLDTYNLAFPRQQRTAYQQQAVAIDGGE